MTDEQRRAVDYACDAGRLLPSAEYQQLHLVVLRDILDELKLANRPASEPAKPAATKPTRRRSRGAKKGD